MLVQIGQCGNQLGERVLAEMAAAKDARFAQFFSAGGGAHAVAVDMEPKVIERLMGARAGWGYLPRLAFTAQEGSGNNWAHGFYSHGRRCRAQVVDCIRRCLELSGAETAVTLQSLAGGTGSGLGSLVAAAMRDEFPDAGLLSVMVAPRLCGENTLQNYNAVFSLATCYEHVDALLLLENDQAHADCAALLNLKNVNVDDLNGVFAAALLPAFAAHDAQATLPALARETVPLPGLKLLSARSSPLASPDRRQFEGDSWAALIGRQAQMLLCGRCEAQLDWRVQPGGPGAQRCLAARLALHSPARFALQESAPLGAFSAALFSARLARPALAVVAAAAVEGYTRAVSLVANSQAHTALLRAVLARAERLLGQRAYLHQYLKFGMEEEEVRDHFYCVRRLIELYAAL